MESDIIEPYEVGRQRYATDVRAKTEYVMQSLVINIMAPGTPGRLRWECGVRVQVEKGM